MELLIQPDQFVIQYPPAWMFILLSSGLVLFFVSKYWRQRLKQSGQHSFYPGVFFTVSFIFIIGGINLYVYKVIFNKDGITFFNIKNFNQQIKWSQIKRVDYQPSQRLTFYLHENSGNKTPVAVDWSELDEGSMEKVKVLIQYKTRIQKLPEAN